MVRMIDASWWRHGSSNRRNTVETPEFELVRRVRAKIVKPLTAIEVRRLETPGLHAVGTVPGQSHSRKPRRRTSLRTKRAGGMRSTPVAMEQLARVSRFRRSASWTSETSAWRRSSTCSSRSGERRRRGVTGARANRADSFVGRQGERERLNPARWRGHLDTQLAAPTKVRKPKHHAALPVSQAGSLSSLRGQEGAAARALEFVILTAARSGEVRFATWLDRLQVENLERRKENERAA